MPPPVLVCGEWEEERVRDMWVCERDAFRSYTFCPRFSPQVEGSLQCWRVCVCVCVRVFVWSLQYYVFLFPEEFFEKKVSSCCSRRVRCSSSLRLAKWKHHLLGYQYSEVGYALMPRTQADVCWRMLTYADVCLREGYDASSANITAVCLSVPVSVSVSVCVYMYVYKYR